MPSRTWRRLTIRGVLILVAASALISWWLLSRRAAFGRLSAYHDLEAAKHLDRPAASLPGRPGAVLFLNDRGKWHSRLAAKYADAAAHPWWPVGDDPSPPE